VSKTTHISSALDSQTLEAFRRDGAAPLRRLISPADIATGAPMDHPLFPVVWEG
jgi:hypothetical protein